MIQRLIAFLARHATAVLAIGVLAGLALPSWSAVARPALGPAVWLLLVVAVIRVDWPQIRAHLRRRALLGAAMVWMLVGAPLAMWAVLGNTALAPGLVTAMVLMAGSSPINSAPALALLLGLDGALSLLLLFVATVVMPMILPFIALYVLGLELAVTPWEWMARLGLFIATALVAGGAVRWAVGRARLKRWADGFDLFVVFLLLLFAIAIMDGVGARLAAQPAFVLGTVALAFGGYTALLVAGGLLFQPWGRVMGLTVGFTNANRNMGVMLAVLPAGADPDIALFFALGQLPMYIMPAILAPLFRRMVRHRHPGEPLA
ncbi:MAG: hypothetical protein KDE22_12895 [Rhodobacterales bacterium]|nr:hypothetical protein [Rhodobacterales bacterium]